MKHDNKDDNGHFLTNYRIEFDSFFLVGETTYADVWVNDLKRGGRTKVAVRMGSYDDIAKLHAELT